MVETLYRMYNVSNNDYLELAKLDYNYCQKLHQLEWIAIEMWYEDYNLREFGLYKDDLLKFYFIAMSSIFEPEQANVRLTWAKTAALIELVSVHFKENSIGQKKGFIEAFENREFGSNGARNKLVYVIHKSLDEFSLQVQEVHGKDVYHNLKHCWNTWLLRLQTYGDDYAVPNSNEAELLVCTINLCSEHSSLIDLIPQSEYLYLTNLTNEICNNLRQTENFEVGMKKMHADEMVTDAPTNSIDLQMQELVQHVVKGNAGIYQKIKGSFLIIAKAYYYTAYCDPATIDLDIARVLFEQVD